MLPGPVFNVELITSARRARFYALRFLYGAILLFLVWQNDPANYPGYYTGYYGGSRETLTIQQMASLGFGLFSSFAIAQSVTVLLLTPALLAGVIAEEKQRKTLHYLLASRLSSAEIILGKLCARLLYIGVFLALGFPVLSMISLFGGVPPELIFLTFSGIVTSVFLLACVSILISTYARRPREAISLVYVLEVSWLFLPWMVRWIMPMGSGIWLQIYEWIRPVVDWTYASSPMSLIRSVGLVGGTAALTDFAWMVGLQLGVGALCLFVAVVRLRPVFRKQGDTSRWVAALGSLRRGRRLLPRPDCGDDGMLWKERYVSRTSTFTKVVAGLIVLVVGGLITYSAVDFAKPALIEVVEYGYGSTTQNSARQSFSHYLRILSGVVYVVWALAIASASSGSVAHEREEDTWTSLMATPLEGFDILRAKFFGAVWGTRWLGALLLVLWTAGLATGSLHLLGYVAAIVESVVFIWFATALGTSVSLWSKHSGRAMTATLGIMLVLNGGYTLCCIPLHPDSVFIVFGITPALLGMSLVSYEDVYALVGAGSYSGRNYPEACAACLFGTLAYAAAAFALTIYAFSTFDKAVDRPRRIGYVPIERTLGKGLPETDDEIEYLDS